MVVINGDDWALALNSLGDVGGVVVISEMSLRYMIKEDLEFLDLTDYNIRDNLKLENFGNLEILDCSAERKLSPLTKEYNDPSRNNITILDLSECPKLRKLNCSNNAELTELNIRNCSNLANINVIGCLRLRKVICDNTPYSSEEIIKQAQASVCLNYTCQEVVYNNGYCNMHQRHQCKKEGCNSQIHVSKEYCFSHRSICKIFGCSVRTSPNSDCDYHKKRQELMHERNRLREQIAVKENKLKQLISSAKNELVSKSIFPVKRSKKEAASKDYLDSLLAAQKQFAQPVLSQKELERNEKNKRKYLIKKLSEEKIQNLCKTQIELTKLEINLAELEKMLC